MGDEVVPSAASGSGDGLPFSLTAKQQELHRLLLRVSPGLASTYRDACRLMHDKPANVVHLTAHLMREMESGLRAVCLTPISWKIPAKCKICALNLEEYRAMINAMITFNGWNNGVLEGYANRCPKCGYGIQKTQVEAILLAYEWSPKGDIGRYWLNAGFHKFAHRHGQLEPRQLDDEFLEMWEKFQVFLWAVAKKLETQSTTFIDHLDELLAKPVPTDDDVDRLLNKIPANSINHWHFFDRLQHPGWFKLLQKKGVFTKPLEPTEDGSFPAWPAGRYIVRMAAVPALQEEVMVILASMATSKNPIVIKTIIEAAKVLPPDKGALFAVHAKPWLELRRVTIGYQLSEFMEHLAKNGCGVEAVLVARALLTILPTDEEGLGMRGDITTLVDTYEFDSAVEEKMLVVVDSAGMPALELLCETLDVALRQTKEGATGDDQILSDYSHIWRHLISDQPTYYSHEKINQLVTAVRDASKALAIKNPLLISEILACLRQYKWAVFKRIELHFLAELDSPPAEEVRAHLLDNEFFEEGEIRREYNNLAEKHGGLLTEAQKQILIGWIEAGRDIDRYRDSMNKWEGKLPTPEQERKYVAYWQMERAYPFKYALAGTPWEQNLQKLVDEFGEPEKEERTSAFARAVGDVSPLTEAEIAKMSVEEITDYMRSWKSTGEWDEPDMEGLGHQMQRLIAKDPTRFALEAKRFEGLDPIYIRSFISAMQEVVKDKKTFPWKEVLELCSWVMSQPREIPGRARQKFDVDPDWSWTRMAIVRLLNAGFEEGDGSIPIELRQTVWVLLEALTNDPDPTPEHEAEYGGNNQDPYTLAINSVRSKAIEAVIFYIFWVYRHQDKKLDTDVEREELRKVGVFPCMPEVESVLDLHIDAAKEPSLAVRSVYGRWLANLDSLAHPWVQKSLSKLFPKEDKFSDQRDIVWETYIVASSLYKKVYETLTDEYSRFVDALKDPPKVKGRYLGDPLQHFGSHIMLLYLRSIIEINTADNLLQRFFENATDELRGAAIGGVGQIFQNDDTLKRETIERAQLLWEYRLAIIKAAADPSSFSEEVGSFAWWVVCEKFDDAWTLAQLKEALIIAKDIDVDFMVVKRLAVLSDKFPIQCIECLQMIVEGKNKARWGAGGYMDDAKKVIRIVYSKGTKEAMQKARDLVGVLVSLSALNPAEAKEFLDGLQ